MRRTLRPFVALVGILMLCTVVQAQSVSPAFRAHQNNHKHKSHADRLEASAHYEEALLKPYVRRSPLIKHTRKGVRPPRVSAPVNKDPQQLYLDLRSSKHTTREETKVDAEE